MAYEDQIKKLCVMLYKSLAANKSKLVGVYKNLTPGEELALRIRFHIRKPDLENVEDKPRLRLCHECVRKATDKNNTDRKALLTADDLDVNYAEDLE